MTLRQKLSRNIFTPYDIWRKNLKRSFRLLVGGLTLAWIAAGLFTVWLLRG